MVSGAFFSGGLAGVSDAFTSGAFFSGAFAGGAFTSGALGSGAFVGAASAVAFLLSRYIWYSGLSSGSRSSSFRHRIASATSCGLILDRSVKFADLIRSDSQRSSPLLGVALSRGLNRSAASVVSSGSRSSNTRISRICRFCETGADCTDALGVSTSAFTALSISV